MTIVISARERNGFPDGMRLGGEPLSGRAAFDRELSELARREAAAAASAPRGGRRRLTEEEKAAKPKRKRKPAPRRRAASKEKKPRRLPQAVIERQTRYHRELWELFGRGYTSVEIERRVGLSHKRMGFYLAKGKPPEADWFDISAQHIDADCPLTAARAAMIMNLAARKWSCPAPTLLGRGSRSTVRTARTSMARTEVIGRLRIHFGLSILIICRILNINHVSVMEAIKRFEREDAYAPVRAELAGARP